MENNSPLDGDLADQVAEFYADPLGFVLFAYSWDTDPLLRVCKLPEPWSLVYNTPYGPDAWACQFLEDLGQRVRENAFDGVTAVAPIRESVVSGHGIGKSAMMGWITNWIMSTRPHAVGTVTANTGPQLETKTWGEIAKWTKRCITGHWFDVSTGRGSMKMVHKQFPESWKCTAQTCAKENSEAFAGQHAATSTSFYLFDEASAIDDVIDEVSEGGMTDGEPMKIAFGNGTRNTGWFRRTFKSTRWRGRHVDSREVQITNKQNIQEMIDDHGIDSDRVKVRVRGMFPSQSVKQFISTADVDAAAARHLHPSEYSFAPKILTLDNAWEGDDDGVISLRQGAMFKILDVFAKNDNDMVVGARLAHLEKEHGADAVFIDAGYGTGVYSYGVTIGRSWRLVWFGGTSPDPGYLNMRAYMWGQMRDWLKTIGAIEPKDHVLYNELIGPETVPRADGKIQLESKKDMKSRGEASPGRGDALALSFAHPVASKHTPMNPVAPAVRQLEHNPFDNLA